MSTSHVAGLGDVPVQLTQQGGLAAVVGPDDCRHACGLQRHLDAARKRQRVNMEGDAVSVPALLTHLPSPRRGIFSRRCAQCPSPTYYCCGAVRASANAGCAAALASLALLLRQRWAHLV